MILLLNRRDFNCHYYDKYVKVYDDLESFDKDFPLYYHNKYFNTKWKSLGVLVSKDSLSNKDIIDKLTDTNYNGMYLLTLVNVLGIIDIGLDYSTIYGTNGNILKDMYTHYKISKDRKENIERILKE